MMRRRFGLAAGAAAALAALSLAGSQVAARFAAGDGGPARPIEAQAVQEETPETLPDFVGREETFGYCIGCHSMRVVTRQGMSRERWDDTLTWMSEKHNMPVPDAETRRLLLDYLARAFPPQAAPPGGGWVSPFSPKG